MIAFYRRKTRAPYIVVHDADDTAEWLKQGFVRAAPPEGIAPDDVIEVLIWGELPIDIDVFLKRHGLSWSREQHRVGTKYRHIAPPSFYLQVPMA